MKESNAGKQCIMVQFPRSCTPKICGLLFCKHAEDVETFKREVEQHNEEVSKRNATNSFIKIN